MGWTYVHPVASTLAKTVGREMRTIGIMGSTSNAKPVHVEFNCIENETAKEIKPSTTSSTAAPPTQYFIS
jgi:hypothetical protein